MKKVSIQDISKDLGLSRNTVSKALADSDTVAYETRIKVQKHALELGYGKLNPEIKKKFEEYKKNVIKNIALIINIQNIDFWNRIIIGISEELRKNNYNLLLNYINEDDEKNLILPSNILEGKVDGIIVMSVLKKEYLDKINQLGLPSVFLDNPMQTMDDPLDRDVLVVEGRNSMYQITTELIKCGCRRIGFIGYSFECESLNLRWRGYRDAMNANGINIDNNICFCKSEKYNFYLEEDLAKCLSEVTKPDAFVCINDDIAINAIKYYKSIGYIVPDDISITGFDDQRNAKIVEPQLTTVHVYNEKIGKKLVQQLIWRMENRDMPYEKIYMGTSTVYRNSNLKLFNRKAEENE